MNLTNQMKRKLIALSRRYVTVLRKHLQQGPRAIPPCGTAHEWGCQAAALNLETLDVARIHEAALVALGTSSSRNGLLKRAEIFFAEAISPIPEAHRAALKAGVRLSRLNQALGRRTVDLAASNRSLKQGIARRKTVEQAHKKNGGDFKKTLKESRCLQEHLRQLTRHILAAQENNRSKISHELQDEIAQTLLGINVRLFSVKKTAGFNDQVLQKEIASTQRLVEKSVQSINRFARKLDLHGTAGLTPLRQWCGRHREKPPVDHCSAVR